MWLSVGTLKTRKRDSYYVPESVIRCIPSYNKQLDEKLAAGQDIHDISISDAKYYPRAIVTETIRYLTTGYLCPLGDPVKTLGHLFQLVNLYEFSVLLSIERLELGVLAHIDGFHDISVDLLWRSARFYYDVNGNEGYDETSLGRLIKKKLAELLPQMIERKIVDEIKIKGGLLAQQLMEVLLEKVIASETKQPGMPDQAALIKAEQDDK